MENFISKGDYSASIHTEILDAITRSDATVIEICEDRAIAEMKGYLKGRYDVEKAFAARGDERHGLLLGMAIDLTIYHLSCIHNPRSISPIRKDRYDRAMEWLRRAQKGDLVVDGLPPAATEVRAAAYDHRISSNPKRTSYI